ncbi:MAG: Decaprenyl-diphosphate synthase subunit 1, partial [Paramarteilia canceri]
DISNDCVKIAAIAEMIHTASLIVDDIVDNADVRRGITCLHKKYGIEIAFRSANIIVAQCTDLLCQLDSTIHRPEILSRFSRVLSNMVTGEILQHRSQSKNKLRSIIGYLRASYCKTASLFEATCGCVALLHAEKYPDKRVGFAMNFGKSFGIAFQLADDILDYTAKKSFIGKPNGLDMKNGLLSGPLLFALRHLSRKLGKTIDTSSITQSELEKGFNKNIEVLYLELKKAKIAIENLGFTDLKTVKILTQLLNLIEERITRSRVEVDYENLN